MHHLQLVAPTAAPRPAAARRTGAASGAPYVRRRLQNGLILALGDATTLLLATAIGLSVGWMTNEIPDVPMWTWWLPAGWVLAALTAGLYPGWSMGRLEALRRMLGVFATVFALAAVGTLLAGEPLRLPFFVTVGTAFLAAPTLRAQTRRGLRSTGAWGVPVVVYGACDHSARILRRLRRSEDLGLDPLAVVDDNPARQGRIVEGFQVLGRAGDRVPVVDTAVLAMPESDRRRRLLQRLTDHYERVIVLDEELDAIRLVGRARDFDGMLAREVSSPLRSLPVRLAKRGVELLILAVTAPIWGPLLALIALAVWLEDRTTPFSRQVRLTRDGRPFPNLRFRTVVPNTGETLRSCLREDAELHREWETRFRLVDDPRVTRVGRVLRRLELDGLPQIFNVLRGQMALVGPEPLPPYRYGQRSGGERNDLRYAAPGMTGLWKVHSDREDASTDAYYLRRWSMGLDLAILMQSWGDLLARANSSSSSARPT